MSSISRSHRQGSAGSGVKDQPERCQPSGDAGTSSITRNTTSIRGDERTRTADPLLAKQVLYQLSYVPSRVRDALRSSLSPRSVRDGERLHLDQVPGLEQRSNLDGGARRRVFDVDVSVPCLADDRQ